MIGEREAREQILEMVGVLDERTVALANALDCFSAQNYFARLPLPAFDNSAMDGYAVVASACKKRAKLRVIGEQPAGPDRKLSIDGDEAIRIFTGAPLPRGADAIVMQEDVRRDGSDIIVNVEVEAGDFVRRRGCDLTQGQIILARGERIRPATIALLASQGFPEVTVGGKATAAIISTGDELVKPGKELLAGQIYDSNSVLLSALLQRCGANTKSVEHCRDNRESLTEAVKRGIKTNVLIVSGGVSVGEHDLVKEVLREVGAKIEIWRVAVKPGKPFLFGNLDGCFVFGLPGNPVSAFVTFLQFVRPAVLRMMGATNLDPRQVPAKLAADVANDSDRPHYIRGKFRQGRFTPVGRQESHAIFGLTQANALFRLGVGESRKTDEIVDIQILD
ncbi:MAG TPA: gephyrin-like molybdotransferase Glp [Candidatus Udaeobacter sp.]|jgi:molybdopterin molybdotransferase|nr:gephyrin-like molybdotransferase Glp [Candidatus Udaeobacter sp.]HEU0274744.1 gephyrin-like molybdotransferase Glp [Candidatus Udaeobacter sp.]